MTGFQQENYKAWQKEKNYKQTHSVKRPSNDQNQTHMWQMLELSDRKFKVTIIDILRTLS